MKDLVSEARVDLLQLVGEYYFFMHGKPDSAVACFEEAVNIASLLDPDLTSSDRLAKANEWLAKCYLITQKLPNAELHLNKALQIVVKNYGKESVEAAKIFHTVGNL
jgi:hypothetical protein